MKGLGVESVFQLESKARGNRFEIRGNIRVANIHLASRIPSEGYDSIIVPYNIRHVKLRGVRCPELLACRAEGTLYRTTSMQ